MYAVCFTLVVWVCVVAWCAGGRSTCSSTCVVCFAVCRPLAAICSQSGLGIENDYATSSVFPLHSYDFFNCAEQQV